LACHKLTRITPEQCGFFKKFRNFAPQVCIFTNTPYAVLVC
jgi:hypothetical protein